MPFLHRFRERYERDFAEREDAMHFRVTNQKHAQLLTDRLCAMVAQGKIQRSTFRKVYIQRSAFSKYQLTTVCDRYTKPCVNFCKKWFAVWASSMKPNGNGAVVSVAAFALAAVFAISFCSLSGEKRRLEAEKNQLAAENAQLNTNVDSLTNTVDALVNDNKQKDQQIQDEKDKNDTLRQEQAEQLGGLVDGLASRSESHSAATTQIAQIREAIYTLLADSPEDADALLTKLAQEEAKVNWHYNHIPDYYPTYGTLTSRYGYRRDPVSGAYTSLHAGIDIGNVVGTPIHAAGEGTVIMSGTYGNYGLCVIIDHGNGYKTLYGHMSKLLVSVGDVVSKSERIGLMGATGRVTGSHLHFEVHLNNKTIDPFKVVG